MGSVRAGRGLRFGLLGLAGIIIMTFQVIACDSAEARWWRKRQAEPRATASISSDSRYADIVVDGNTGATLHAVNPDSLRHPASLTKIMTLYLLFERLESGKIKLDTEMSVSAEAASQAPTKLGVKPGQTLEVEDAIKALVTKSANDAAVVIAEHLAGDEDEFAKLMTRKARALGMSKTTYKNASGLPDDDQVTTARDQALLGLAIQERFPRYYRYFSTPSFSWRGNGMRNHNKLLGRVAGVDGIKTGYTHASGFNLVTSMRRGNRHLVAVVLGGPTGGQRDARMASLLDQYITVASTQRTATKLAEAQERAAPEPADPRQKGKVASAPPMLPPVPEAPRTEAVLAKRADPPVTVATTAAIPNPPLGSTEPIRPLMVKTLSVRPGAIQTASLAPIVPAPEPARAAERQPERVIEALPPPPGKTGILGILSMRSANAAEIEPRPPAPASRETHARSGWMIQVGAFPEESEARQKLSSAKHTASRLLGDAEPFTEAVQKGDRTLYRARFAGLEKDQAESACKALKRNDIACMAIKN